MKTPKRKKVVFFIRELHSVMGGAEKQMLKIAHALQEKGFFITIISLDLQVPELFFQFSRHNIEFKFIGGTDPQKKASLWERILRQVKLFWLLRSGNFNLGIAFMTGAYFFSVLPCKLTRTPIILAERNSPSMYFITSKSKYKSIIFLFMILADAITIQFERFRNSYPKYLERKFTVIPNQINAISIRDKQIRKNFNFVFAGRLCYQKQILELIQAFNIHSQHFSDSSLFIFGDGELQNQVINLIDSLGLNNRVKYFGPTKNIDEIFINADILCIPSLWEGFPNILGEAFSAGIPAIGYNDCDGVIDIIENNVNGWLVDRSSDQSSFANKMTEISNLKNISDFSYQALQKSRIFENKSIYDDWEKIVLKIGK